MRRHRFDILSFLSGLVFAGAGQKNRLYLNRGGFRFEDQSEAAGIAGSGSWSSTPAPSSWPCACPSSPTGSPPRFSPQGPRSGRARSRSSSRTHGTGLDRHEYDLPPVGRLCSSVVEDESDLHVDAVVGDLAVGHLDRDDGVWRRGPRERGVRIKHPRYSATSAIMSPKRSGLALFSMSRMPRDSNWNTAEVLALAKIS